MVNIMEKISTGVDYVFPIRFSGRSCYKKLRVELKISAIQCGYSLAQRTSKNTSKLSNSEYAVYFTLYCRKHLLCDENVRGKRSIKGIYKTRTHLSTTKESMCPFSFNVGMRKKDNRWVLKAPTYTKLRWVYILEINDLFNWTISNYIILQWENLLSA